MKEFAIKPFLFALPKWVLVSGLLGTVFYAGKQTERAQHAEAALEERINSEETRAEKANVATELAVNRIVRERMGRDIEDVKAAYKEQTSAMRELARQVERLATAVARMELR